MLGTQKLLLAAAIVGVGAALAPVHAQPPNDSNISFDAGALLHKKPRPSGLPDVRPQPLAWPRLDPGAVVCRTEDDLSRLALRRSGQPVEGAIDCKIIQAATPISIEQRNGPGRTEVKATDPDSTTQGWTDAWLPVKAPSLPTSASR